MCCVRLAPTFSTSRSKLDAMMVQGRGETVRMRVRGKRNSSKQPCMSFLKSLPKFSSTNLQLSLLFSYYGRASLRVDLPRSNLVNLQVVQDRGENLFQESIQGGKTEFRVHALVFYLGVTMKLESFYSSSLPCKTDHLSLSNSKTLSFLSSLSLLLGLSLYFSEMGV